jgi:hypothetical protein
LLLLFAAAALSGLALATGPASAIGVVGSRTD